MAPDVLTVGGANVSVDAAKGFVQQYLNSPSEFWAYPAYDSYPGGAGRELSEQDLLAPILLNVQHLSLSAYYALVGALPMLNSVLDRLGDELTLFETSETDLANIAELFSILDQPGLPGVQLTTLSKVLHRMRPCLIPLYDDHIRRCYQVMGSPPVPVVRGRSWSDFSHLWLRAVRSDLVRHHPHWQMLAELAPGPAISPLRALDIVGWRVGNKRLAPLEA